MRKLVYSPNALETLEEIKGNVTFRFGATKSKEVLKNMTKDIRKLREYGLSGTSVAAMTGIPTDYRMLYTQHNYVFYTVDDDFVRVAAIFNEREDFMWTLFGIKTTSEESEHFWDD